MTPELRWRARRADLRRAARVADNRAVSDAVRLDKWLWAARLYKTRSLAAEQIELGRVSVNGAPAKAARELRPGDRIGLRRAAGEVLEVEVRALARQRGPASVARLLYEETADSRAERERRALAARLAPEPAASGQRPTKRDRRELAAWQRWSAGIDDG